MGKRIPYSIAGLEFPTKKAAADYIRGIVARCQGSGRVEPPDEDFVLELLLRHPEYDDKRGAGIECITVGADPYGNYCFHVNRVDGSVTDFSWVTCLDGKRNHRGEVLGALRRAVADQVLDFKSAEFRRGVSLRCPFDGSELTPGNCDVDHAPPATFLKIASQWIDGVGGIEVVKITAPQDMQFCAELVCPQQTASWQDHHRRLANLRLLSKRANLSDAKRERK